MVLRAHREAVNNLSGSGSAQLGTVATVVAAANSTAMEASKEIEAAMKISLRTALGSLATKPNDGQLDDLTIMKVFSKMLIFSDMWDLEFCIHTLSLSFFKHLVYLCLVICVPWCRRLLELKMKNYIS